MLVGLTFRLGHRSQQMVCRSSEVPRLSIGSEFSRPRYLILYDWLPPVLHLAYEECPGHGCVNWIWNSQNHLLELIAVAWKTR